MIVLITLSLPLINEIVVILIDDDELVRTTWDYRAKLKKVPFSGFASINDFLKQEGSIDKNSYIFIDNDLGGGSNGAEFAKLLNQKGFTNLNLATGSSKDDFHELTFLKSIQEKKVPSLLL